MTETAEKFPVWRHAIDAFMSAGFVEGDIVPRDWFETALNIRPPQRGTREDFQRADLAFVAGFVPLRDALMEDHGIYLDTVQGEGYRIVPPQEQVSTIVKRGKNDVSKSIRKSIRFLGGVDQTQLTAEQREEHAREMQRLGMVRSVTRMSDKRLAEALEYRPPSRPKLIEAPAEPSTT